MDDAREVERVELPVRPATAEALAPFGWLIGRGADTPVSGLGFYPGELRKPAAFVSDADTELSVATLERRAMEVRWLERHFKHTQTFLPLGGRPFVLVMAPPGDAPLPDLDRVEAFLFDGSAGFCMRIGCWHEFPFALVDGTDLVVILRGETHRDLQRVENGEATGADLEKRDVRARTGRVFQATL